MGGAFDASAEFDDDPLVTADEIQDSGQRALKILGEVASSPNPWAVDFTLVKEIHFRWFETTFPADAGEFRTAMVLNRKGTTWRKLDEAQRASVVDAASAQALMREQASVIKRPVVEWDDGRITVGFDADDWATRL